VHFLKTFHGDETTIFLSPTSCWPDEWWSTYFFITSLVVTGSPGVISSFWFLIGGIIDIRRLFRDLAARTNDPLDNGRVEGHVSLVDKAKFEARTGEKQDD
jgi:solute:Na+ symporter, SSS family